MVNHQKYFITLHVDIERIISAQCHNTPTNAKFMNKIIIYWAIMRNLETETNSFYNFTKLSCMVQFRQHN